MLNISTKYSNNFDYLAILTSRNGNLTGIGDIIDINSAKKLSEKASKNKKGFTFISQIIKSKFKNFYFYNIDKNKPDYEYQNIGGQIIKEELNLKKKKKEDIIENLEKNI